MKRLLACIFCGTIIMMAQSSLMALYPTELQNSQETLMLFAQQVDDPAHILQASFGADNTLLEALLENRKQQKIVSYRLGWVAIKKKEDVRIVKGDLVAVPADTDTASTFSITGQGTSTKADLARHPTGLVFFIAELQLQDGSQWQADLKKIRQEATSMVK